MSILMGNEGDEHVVVRISGRERPEEDGFFDGNWLVSEVQIRVGGFRATYRTSLRSEELQSFQRQLRALDRTLAGEAVLDTMDGDLRLVLTGDGKGHVSLVGAAGGPGNTFEFRLAFDQTYLTEILRGVDEALVDFPVVGHPWLRP